MHWDVTKIEAKENFTLLVNFADGTSGYVKFLKAFFTGVFEPLKDPLFFQKVYVSDGAVTWPGELDIAPDAMYHHIKDRGEWVIS